MAVKNIYKTLIMYCIFIVSQSSIRWDIKQPVIFGTKATLSCNGNGCVPTSIRKWIGGPSYGVLCFDHYSSNPAKYQMIYNKTKPSFDLMIENFNFIDANCEYTCACGFYQYTYMLNMDEIDFVYPPDTKLDSRNKQEDGKLYIDMSMKVYPFPNCTIVYKNTVLPVKTFIVKEEVRTKLYQLRLKYTLSLDYTNCRENVTVSCKVRSLEFPLLQEELDLCKDYSSDTKLYIFIILGVIGGFLIILLVIYAKRKIKREQEKRRKRWKTMRNRCLSHDIGIQTIK